METETTRKPRVPGMDEETKKKALLYVYELTKAIAANFEMEVPKTKPYCMMQLYNVVYRVHLIGRKNMNCEGRVKIPKLQKISSFEQSYRIEDIIYTRSFDQLLIILDGVLTKLGITMKTAAAEYHQIICHLQLFHERARELELGPDSYVKTKFDQGIQTYKIRNLGLSSSFRHFLSGLAWDENIRGTLSTSTTGVAQATLLAVGKPDSIYTKQNKVAVDRAFNFVTDIDKITDYMYRNNLEDCTPILKRLANLSAIHGDKHKRKISLNFAVIWSLITNLDGSFTDSDVEKICFSSKKGSLTYKSFKSMCGPANTALFKQWYFHCTFGTHGEDHGILAYQTNQYNWAVREEMTPLLRAIKEDRHTTSMEPIKLLKYSKNITGSQTDMITRGETILGACAMSSGYRKKFFNQALWDGHRTILCSDSLSAISEHLDYLLTQLKKKILEKKNIDGVRFVNTKWYMLEGATYEKGVNGEAQPDVPAETGTVFWSPRSK